MDKAPRLDGRSRNIAAREAGREERNPRLYQLCPPNKRLKFKKE